MTPVPIRVSLVMNSTVAFIVKSEPDVPYYYLRAAVAEGLGHHFMLRFCNPEYFIYLHHFLPI